MVVFDSRHPLGYKILNFMSGHVLPLPSALNPQSSYLIISRSPPQELLSPNGAAAPFVREREMCRRLLRRPCDARSLQILRLEVREIPHPPGILRGQR